MSFTKRRIDLKFTLGGGTTAVPNPSFEGGADQVTLSGLRCSANITKAGGSSQATLDLTVYGMTRSQMNALTILNTIQYSDGAAKNRVVVSAGDDKSVSVCFDGDITEAWTDPHGQPEVAFRIRAAAGHLSAVKPANPTSYDGDVDVATVLADIAQKMEPPRTLENSGVTAQLHCPYYPGSLLDQAKAAAVAAGCYLYLDDNVVAIWPKDGARNVAAGTVSPETGLVGYPAFSQNNIDFTTLYSSTFAIGGKVTVKSSLDQASGTFVVAKIVHNLDSETPGGPWFSHLECGIIGQEAPVASGTT